MNKNQNLGRSLSKDEQKKIMGGDVVEDVSDGGCRCLGCNTDQECAAVNKGTCTKDCEKPHKCCSGW